MGEVVEKKPGRGHRSEVLDGGGLPLGEPRLARLQRERNEREEPRAFVLRVPQAEHVRNPLLVRLDVAVEQGRVRGNPHPVRDSVNFEPPLGAHLVLKVASRTLSENTSAPPPGSDWSPALWSRSSTAWTCNLRDSGEPVDLDRGPGLDLNSGISLPDGFHDLEVLLELPLRGGDRRRYGPPRAPG